MHNYQNSHPDDSDIKFDLFCDILLGVIYLHNNSIVHRDIKPENCLLNLKIPGRPKALLSDFGASLRLYPGELINSYAGTPFYMAPEVK